MKLPLSSLVPLALFNVPLTEPQQPADVGDWIGTYDFVVVGGGNAGLAVASRLTEHPNVSVVVLEAGPNVEHLPEVFIPGLIGKGETFKSLNWAYSTTPQPHLNGRQVVINAGKALGGGTIINSMIFPRALEEQYDSWSSLNNNDPNWTWTSLLKYFKRTESFIPPADYQIASGVRYLPQFHGSAEEGRIKVGFPNYFYPQSALWRQASGLDPSPDLSNGDPQGMVGVAPNSLDARNNTRCSAVCGYYTPFSSRPNLKVLTNVTVSRILWSPDMSLRAEGVEFYTSAMEVQRVRTRKEVILSAGTLGSPKILELSGVGNRTVLRNAGVDVVKEFPTIGENLADHVHGWANSFTNASVTKDSLLLDPDFADQEQNRWYKNRTGLLSSAPRSLGLAGSSDLFPADSIQGIVQDARDHLSYYAETFANGNDKLKLGIEKQHTLMLDAWDADRAAPAELNLEPGYSGPTPFPERPARKYTSINAVLFGPLSRGRVHITSSDPFVPPAVDPAYYAHPLDLTTHVKAIQKARTMLQNSPLDQINEGEYEPGLAYSTDSEVADWAREVSTSDNHVMGSLAMMPQELGGVVDTRLRVYGIENVRVVDASMIPLPISAHIMSSVYAIAERAADFIREDYDFAL